MDGVNRIALEVGAEKYVSTSGYGCKPGFAFYDEKGEVSAVARTLFLQETIAEGLLMPYMVPSLAHTPEVIEFALSAIRPALVKIKAAAEGCGLANALKGPAVKPVFRKFN